MWAAVYAGALGLFSGWARPCSSGAPLPLRRTRRRRRRPRRHPSPRSRPSRPRRDRVRHPDTDGDGGAHTRAERHRRSVTHRCREPRPPRRSRPQLARPRRRRRRRRPPPLRRPARRSRLCHANSDGTYTPVTITLVDNAVDPHFDHDDDLIPAPATGCGAGAQPDEKVGVCHATGDPEHPVHLCRLQGPGKPRRPREPPRRPDPGAERHLPGPGGVLRTDPGPHAGTDRRAVADAGRHRRARRDRDRRADGDRHRGGHRRGDGRRHDDDRRGTVAGARARARRPRRPRPTSPSPASSCRSSPWPASAWC